MAELTLEEARKLYESNESFRSFLESKFSKDELTSESIEEKFNRVWNEEILPKCKSVRYLDKKGNPTFIPTSRVDVLDSDGKWVFEYGYAEENKHFYYSYNRVYNILKSKVSSDVDVLQPLMQRWVENNLNLKDTIPDFDSSELCVRVENNLNLKDTIPFVTSF